MALGACDPVWIEFCEICFEDSNETIVEQLESSYELINEINGIVMKLMRNVLCAHRRPA